MLTNSRVAGILPALDIDRAISFYKEKLGLEAAKTASGDAAMVRAGSGTMFVVYQRPAWQCDLTQLVFMVDNLEQQMQELRNMGMMFEEYDLPYLKTVNGVATDESGKSAWFKDSEGNIVSIMEPSLEQQKLTEKVMSMAST